MANPKDAVSPTDFNDRYNRWVLASESGDSQDKRAAEAALPSLNNSVRARLQLIDEEVKDPQRRAEQRRLVVLVSEARLVNLRRRRKKKEAEQRRRDRTTLIERSVDLPTQCARCGSTLTDLKTTGRPRLYCSQACRKAAYEDRRAHREGAVQVVEKVVTDVRQHNRDVTHPKTDCIEAVLKEAVLKDDAALLQVVRTLIDNVRNADNKAYSTGTRKFWDLHSAVEVLAEELTLRAEAEQIEPRESMNRHQRNSYRMTLPPEN